MNMIKNYTQFNESEKAKLYQEIRLPALQLLQYLDTEYDYQDITEEDISHIKKLTKLSIHTDRYNVQKSGLLTGRVPVPYLPKRVLIAEIQCRRVKWRKIYIIKLPDDYFIVQKTAPSNDFHYFHVDGWDGLDQLINQLIKDYEFYD